MSLFRIALRSIQQRGLASALTMLSMALGVMLIVMVLTIHGVVETSFRLNSQLGYNVVIGANKSGKEQLILNTVYYLSKPAENISYDFYLEFLSQEERDRQLTNSIRVHAAKQAELTHSLSGLALGTIGFAETNSAITSAAQAIAIKQAEVGRAGKYSALSELVIPVCLGDYYGRFRVVATTPDFFNELIYDQELNKKYAFAQGRNFVEYDEKNRYFEAVVGSQVAKEMNVKLGDEIAPQHGEPGGHTHERKFVVVGILESSGTPNDRATFINMEGFYLMNDHAIPVDEIASREASEETDKPASEMSDDELKAKMLAEAKRRATLELEADPEPLPVEQREVTSLIVKTEPVAAVGLEFAINKGQEGQAALPAAVILGLFTSFIDPIRSVLIVLTVVICIVSGISILVSIYNSMSERRQEIAVMRALGAQRSTVMNIILLESLLLSLGGWFLGWIVGHVACWLASPLVEEQTGVTVGFNLWGAPYFGETFLPLEMLIVPGLVLLSVVVGFLPAMSAYNTDVSKSLGK